MGLDSRRPILPAPTDSIVGTTSASTTDLETDVSRRTDKTSYSIPDDGNSITIPTTAAAAATSSSSGQKHRDKGDHSPNSHTSLLIEYFEGGKGSGSLTSRPSVRVRVTPSGGRRSKDHHHHHHHHHHNQQKDTVRISEPTASGVQSPIFTRRISLISPSSNKKQLAASACDDQSPSSSVSAHHQDTHVLSSRQPPVEIEFMDRGGNSEPIDPRYTAQSSDISSMPPDSLLDTASSGPRPRDLSRGLDREEDRHEPDDLLLKTPNKQRSRSLSKERFAQRVAEKISTESRDDSTKKHRQHKRSERSKGSGSANKDPFLEGDPKSSRRSSRGLRDADLGSQESSLISASVVSSQHLPGDQDSYRSSKSSLNNPKLLETVEDAIRRLILPELKELKKDQRVISNTSRFDRDQNAMQSSASAASKGELARRLSKHSSAPDVVRPAVVVRKDSKDEGTVLTSESPKKSRRTSREVESPSGDRPSVSRGTRPDSTEHDQLRRQKSKGLRDAEAAGKVGTALTAAALSRHESHSSLDSKESRKNTSRASQSRPGSKDNAGPGFNETELVFQKHNVPRMPLHSEVNSGLTRDSLLSQRTEETSALGGKNFREGEVYRGSPIQAVTPNSGSSRTPNRKQLGLHHSNISSHNLSIHSASSSDRDLRGRQQTSSPMNDSILASGDIAAAAAANLLDAYSGFHHDTGVEHSDVSNRRRTLSPIQSVASDKSTETQVEHPPNARNEHAGSEIERGLKPHLSIGSLSSAPSTDLARSTRLGHSVDSRSDAVKHHSEAGTGAKVLDFESPPMNLRTESWGQDSQAEDGKDGGDYRRSEERSSHRRKSDRDIIDDTNDSEIDYLVNKGHQVTHVSGANPKFVQPETVESAVASLLDPSVLTTKSSKVATRSQPEISDQQQQQQQQQQPDRRDPKNAEESCRQLRDTPQGSPSEKHQKAASPEITSFPKRMGVTSPPQSVTQSIEDQDMSTHQAPAETNNDEEESPSRQEAGRSLDSESEINTNPSIIQGPIGGTPHAVQEHHHHWAYNPASPDDAGQQQRPPYPVDDDADFFNRQKMGHGLIDGYSATPAAGGSYDADGFFHQPPGDYMGGQLFETPPGQKDEGYVSAANQFSPKPGDRGLDASSASDHHLGLFENPDEDEPFNDATGHQRNLSGYSHGMGSPLYDNATGKGIERIKSKDIIALMDHLTVRDAQRNARDTELLVTLVRSAAEMRTSFEEMKKFIAQQDEMLAETTDKQHERTQKIIGGPRPLPAGGPRTARQLPSDDGDDMRTKRQNVFKRALKGLNFKSSNDLTRVEDMLEQLLDEVEALRVGQEDGRNSRSGPQDGYGPEGRAGMSTSSPGDRAGYFAKSPRQVPVEARASGMPRNSISTVPEADEDMELDESSPPSERPVTRHARTESAPIHTFPQIQVNPNPTSNGTTPKSAEKNRKSKSSSSSFFPKISRWSKTTASSMGENFRNSMQTARKERPYSDMSYSRSDLSNGHYKTGEFYDPQGDDRLRSNSTLDGQQRQQQPLENRPPSPLVPSQVSETPKYRAHRNSINLQHPQPRQGPSGHYQSRLESRANDFGSPISPNSDQLGSSNPSLLGSGSTVNNSNNDNMSNSNNRYSNGSRLSPISDAGYCETRTPPPPRPPKVRDTGPLVPERPPKVSGEYYEGDGSYADRVVSRSSAMRSTPPLRKPTGPRPLTSGGGGSQYSRTARYRGGSPAQSVD